jgi:transposase-like protein
VEAREAVTPVTPRYAANVREQALLMAAELVDGGQSESAALVEVARALGIGSPESLRRWLRQAEVDAGRRPGVTTDKSDILRQQNRQRAEQNRTESILEAAAVYFDRQRNGSSLVVEFIRTHRGHRDRGGLRWGVEPMCSALTAYGLPIAPATYYEHVARQPTRRESRDARLKGLIAEVYAAHDGAVGARKIWLQLKDQGIPVARCTVERLMRELGLRGGRSRR